MRSRKKTIVLDNIVFRDKQESLDFIDSCEREKKPIHGIEIVFFEQQLPSTDMYKTIWFNQQNGVYEKARVFVSEKMAGKWNYAEFK